MGRNSGGTYTNPIPPFVPGTTIKTQEMNPKFQDIYDALSDSLSRTGQGSMEVPLQLKDGSAASPSLTFASDSGTGLYRPSPYTVRMVSQAATLQEWALTYVNINRPLVVVSPIQDTTALVATGNGTGDGANLTGGAGVANATGARGALATGGSASGSGSGGNGADVVGGSAIDLGNGGMGLLAQGGAASGTGRGGSGVSAIGGSGTIKGLGVTADGGIVGTNAPLDPSGTVRPTRYRFEYSSIPFLANGIYPLNGIIVAQAGNQVSLNAYSRNEGTPVGWEQVRLGIRYDVDGSTGAGGMLELGSSGVSIARGGAATSSVPAAGLTMTNAHIAFANTVTYPSSTTAVKNTLTPVNIPKAWAVFGVRSTGSGNTPNVITSGALYDMFNIQSITALYTGQVSVTFAAPFASSAFKVNVTAEILGSVLATPLIPRVIGRGPSSVTFRCISATGTGDPTFYVFDDTTTDIGFHIDCHGRQ